MPGMWAGFPSPGASRAHPGSLQPPSSLAQRKLLMKKQSKWPNPSFWPPSLPAASP